MLYIKPKPDQTDLKLSDQWLYGKCIFSISQSIKTDTLTDNSISADEIHNDVF